MKSEIYRAVNMKVTDLWRWKAALGDRQVWMFRSNLLPSSSCYNIFTLKIEGGDYSETFIPLY
jgi:hypothetical protein